jgi:hypothetical protein
MERSFPSSRAPHLGLVRSTSIVRRSRGYDLILGARNALPISTVSTFLRLEFATGFAARVSIQQEIQTMRAFQVAEFGAPLEPRILPDPLPGSERVISFPLLDVEKHL